MFIVVIVLLIKILKFKNLKSGSDKSCYPLTLQLRISWKFLTGVHSLSVCLCLSLIYIYHGALPNSRTHLFYCIVNNDSHLTEWQYYVLRKGCLFKYAQIFFWASGQMFLICYLVQIYAIASLSFHSYTKAQILTMLTIICIYELIYIYIIIH